MGVEVFECVSVWVGAKKGKKERVERRERAHAREGEKQRERTRERERFVITFQFSQ